MSGWSADLQISWREVASIRNGKSHADLNMLEATESRLCISKLSQTGPVVSIRNPDLERHFSNIRSSRSRGQSHNIRPDLDVVESIEYLQSQTGDFGSQIKMMMKNC